MGNRQIKHFASRLLKKPWAEPRAELKNCLPASPSDRLFFSPIGSVVIPLKNHRSYLSPCLHINFHMRLTEGRKRRQWGVKSEKVAHDHCQNCSGLRFPGFYTQGTESASSWYLLGPLTTPKVSMCQALTSLKTAQTAFSNHEIYHSSGADKPVPSPTPNLLFLITYSGRIWNVNSLFHSFPSVITVRDSSSWFQVIFTTKSLSDVLTGKYSLHWKKETPLSVDALNFCSPGDQFQTIPNLGKILFWIPGFQILVAAKQTSTKNGVFQWPT